MATTLHLLDEQSKKKAILKFDEQIAKLNHRLKKPRGKLLNFILKIIGFFEEKNSKIIVETLKAD